jgi:phenylacetate-CoA ligase
MNASPPVRDASGHVLGQRLGIGRTAEVFEWRDGEIIKLMRPGFPDGLGEREAAIAGRVDALELDAPRFLGTERVHGRYGLVYERLSGPSMLDQLTRHPWLVDRLARAFAALHAQMHETNAARLSSQITSVRQAIERAYVVYTTSGSTGVPALLVQDRRAVAVMTGLSSVRALGAITPGLLARMLTRVPRQAAVFASGGHFLSTTMFERRLRTAPFRRRIARFFSVLDPLSKLVDQLNAFQPAVLGTYASALAALTAEQEACRLHISPLVITSGGELLTPAVQRRAEEAFSCPVNQSYAASEAMPLALPCQSGRLHLNSDWFVVEPIDAAGRPVPSGTRSDALLVTNLANYVQPVIRYQLGDSVVISDHGCACGTPLATISVEGRTDEILRFPLAGGGEAVIVPMAIATVVEAAGGVRRYQVLQTAADVLTVRLDHDPGADRAEIWQRVRARLADLLQSHGADDVKLRLADESPYANPRSGKLRHVLQGSTLGGFSRPMIIEKDGVEQRTPVSSDARARKSECPTRRIS